MHTLLPTTILDDLALVTIAAVPPMRPTRDSQAMEITLDTPARPSHEGSRPSLARKTIPGPDIIVLHDPEPPEAAVRSPQTSEAIVKGPFIPHPFAQAQWQRLGDLNNTRRRSWGSQACAAVWPSQGIGARWSTR
ncbi:hypothetical protein EV121DRAFT_296686 [Schizophyllum commune]